MKPLDATHAVVIIESMIVASIAAALKGNMKCPEYEMLMADRKSKLAELFEGKS